MNIVTIEKNGFMMNGAPHRIVAGAMHYFRVPRPYWRDRLLKIKACGFNTVETYTAWNLHEPVEGTFDFSGNLDLNAYLESEPYIKAGVWERVEAAPMNVVILNGEKVGK